MDAVIKHLLRLGDTALIAGQRLGEWCGHGPILEEDIALTNITLDQIGQARLLLTEAGNREGNGRSEDDLAFHRDVGEFYNVLLVEQPNGDFGQTIAKLFFLSAAQFLSYRNLLDSSDDFLKAFAEKSLKEVQYHLHHSRDWMLRLGDGTEESNRRLQDGIDQLWSFTGELFEQDENDQLLTQQGVLPAADLDQDWLNLVSKVMEEAKLKMPDTERYQRGGRRGNHGEHLGYILAEMQWLPRAHPEAQW